MSTRPRSELTLTSYRLPPSLADRVAHLPEPLQAALVGLVREFGVEGVDQIVNALAPGGRPSDYAERLPLLRQMAAEMMAQNPCLGRIGGNWRKGMTSVAVKVAASAEGKDLGHSIEATRKWLVREWKKHGRRLLQELRAAEMARTDGKLSEFARRAHELNQTPWMKTWTVFTTDKFCPQ